MVQYSSLSWTLFHRLGFDIFITTSHVMFELQNPCLTGDKHLGCYSPPPLKESHLEIRGERLSRVEKHVIHFPTFAVALGY
jgi:hypothetical protein